jgi:hypothetical protein
MTNNTNSTVQVHDVFKDGAQGDVVFKKVDSIPSEATKEVLPTSETGEYVLGHSETGHNHVMERNPGMKVFTNPKPTGDGLLIDMFFSTDVPVDIVHKRSHDTHGTLRLFPGIWRARSKQREYQSEEENRLAAD